MFGKNQVKTIADVPVRWILATYLGLGHLSGETVRMQSIFAPQSTHTDPLCIYYNKDSQEYRFKCHSSGRFGKIVNLLMEIWGKSFTETAGTIEAAYQQYLASGHSPEAAQAMELHKWQVVAHTVRPWTQDDALFWPAYNINSELLTTDLVKPLSSYAMLKFVNGSETDQGFTVIDKRVYGYFSPQGELYKIYQPMNRERKYLKVGDYLQGEHSLQGHPYLCLASGMKDMLALKSLGLRVDYVAPDSENNLLGYSDLYALDQCHHYTAIFTLLDIDTTGLESMKAYQEHYGLPYCYLNLKKDAADSVKDCGAAAVKEKLAPAMQRVALSYEGFHDKPKLL